MPVPNRANVQGLGIRGTKVADIGYKAKIESVEVAMHASPLLWYWSRDGILAHEVCHRSIMIDDELPEWLGEAEAACHGTQRNVSHTTECHRKPKQNDSLGPNTNVPVLP